MEGLNSVPQPEAMQEYRPKVLFVETNEPAVQELQQNYADQDLGVDLIFADKSLEEAAEMVKNGETDVVIAGVYHDTPTVIRNVIGHSREFEPDREKRKTITSFFIMEKDGEEPIFFADCAVHLKPDPNTLVTIAEQTAESVKHLGYEPVLAFLSLSTFGSASHLEGVQEVQQAAQTFKEKHPDIVSYGEIQFDAAVNSRIFNKKAANAGVEIVDGKTPNVFIFPDGNSGNIGYKIAEQLGGYTAVGPLLDGTYRDMHDSSRGATADALAREAYYAGLLFKARNLVEQHPLPQTELPEAA